MIENAINKAAVLIEAMPYIQNFRGETVVVKFGGSILEDEEAYATILRDVAFMEIIGMRPVIVHGGGKAISRNMAAAGIAPNFVKGLRVTDEKTIDIVDRTLNEEVNPRVREAVKGFRAPAQGFRGQDVFTVTKHVETDGETGEALDWGYVGNVVKVDVSGIYSALNLGIVPVVTPLGTGEDDGKIYNVNADEAAGAMARELQARKLVFLSDVPGLLRDPTDPESIISTLSLHEVEGLIREGVIAGGMLPKVAGAVKALQAGIKKVHIIDAGMPHSLLLELFTEKGVGTEIVHEGESDV